METIQYVRDECLCLASQRAARRLARRFDTLFAPLGLTNGQFSMMVALSGPWAPRLKELAEFLAMDPTTVTAAMKTLERRGWVVLNPDEDDARARRPALTPDGHAIVARALPLWKQGHAQLQDGMKQHSARDLADILSQLG